MDEWTRNQVDAIRALFAAAEQLAIPLWLESGWAIDARLNRVTRLHDDVDGVYPKEREAEYVALLARLGFGGRERTGYGFLIRRKTLVLDTEPCFLTGGEYGFSRLSPGLVSPAEAGSPGRLPGPLRELGGAVCGASRGSGRGSARGVAGEGFPESPPR